MSLSKDVSSKRFGLRATGQHPKDGYKRRGDVFSIRLSDGDRGRLEARQEMTKGPRALGPWLLWFALNAEPPPMPSVEPGTRVLLGFGVRGIIGDDGAPRALKPHDWSFPVDKVPVEQTAIDWKTIDPTYVPPPAAKARARRSGSTKKASKRSRKG